MGEGTNGISRQVSASSLQTQLHGRGRADTPATPHPLWEVARPAWDLVDDLRGGTDRMRSKSEIYLPQFAQETDRDYRSRVAVSTLYNFFVSGVRNVGSLPFGTTVELTAPDDILAWEHDVDRMGNDLTQFCKACLQDILFYGRCIILVNSPIGPEDTPTMAQQAEERLWPYFIRIPPRVAVNWVPDSFERYLRLNVLTWEDVASPDNQWAHVQEKQVRVYRPDAIQVWVKDKTEADKWKMDSQKEWWGLEGFLPVVHSYGEKVQPFLGRSPYQTVAELNARHMRARSEQDYSLRQLRTKFFLFAGVDPSQITASAAPGLSVYAFDSPDVRAEILEFGPEAVEQGYEDLESLRQEMALRIVGLVNASDKTDETATARAMDSAETVADLESLVTEVEMLVKRAYRFAFQWMGQDPGQHVEVEISRDRPGVETLATRIMGQQVPGTGTPQSPGGDASGSG